MKTAGLIVVALIAIPLTGCGGDLSPEGKVLIACQEAITMAAKNPSSAEVPYAKVKLIAGEGVKGDYVVNWRHGDGLRLQNGFGAMIDATAQCFTSDGRITDLSINGETVLK